jgi:hypothetical protein
MMKDIPHTPHWARPRTPPAPRPRPRRGHVWAIAAAVLGAAILLALGVVIAL